MQVHYFLWWSRRFRLLIDKPVDFFSRPALQIKACTGGRTFLTRDSPKAGRYKNLEAQRSTEYAEINTDKTLVFDRRVSAAGIFSIQSF